MSLSPISRILATLSTCLLLISLTPWAFAQQGAGSIKGTVTDQLGGLVVGATIVAKDPKGAEQTATTNATGAYEIRSLAPGKYVLKVSAPGFSVLEEKSVVVKPGATTTLDFQLSIEALEQSVTVDKRDQHRLGSKWRCEGPARSRPGGPAQRSGCAGRGTASDGRTNPG